MHILVTNDDGPPSSHASPYVHCLIRHLQSAGHVISVCLPDGQRSWIGKAHMIGKTLKPSYYRPSAQMHGEDSEGTVHHRPSPSSGVEEWVLIDGTPASCVQIGLNHFFQDRGPVDLVVSGPNYGRNTTAVFALSSGTMGAALEAAVCRYKAIALSFAFFSRNHDPVIIEAACRHSVKVIDALYKQWPRDGSADLYSVNVPLVEGVEDHKTLWTNVLQNYWREGGCFQEIEGDPSDPADEEHKIREGISGEADDGQAQNSSKKGHKHKHFKWAPAFSDVYKSVEESSPGNDGWAVKEGHTSVTPLKANFAHAAGDYEQKELKLTADNGPQELPTRSRGGPKRPTVQAMVAYDDAYVQPLIEKAMTNVFPQDTFDMLPEQTTDEETPNLAKLLSAPEDKALQITSYEQIDFEFAASHPRSCLINSYMIRKALIRKHYLSTTIDHWAAKNPDSMLKRHTKRSEAFEVDYAEFLDDALVEAFDLRESMDRNEALLDQDSKNREWWILKPGMSDRGQGIKLFSSMEELQDIFDTWEAERPDSDDEDDEDDEADDNDAHEGSTNPSGDYITTSHLRHFVAQPYIDPPLLLDGDKRKFHIRTYVLCTGGLTVHVYRHMLALFAAKPYVPPWQSADDIESFLTNTCLQDSPNENAVRSYWDLPLPQAQLEGIFGQICGISGEVFEAAARAMPVHFQAMPNAFEPFGLDFLVDAKGDAWLLEVNAFPDFKQTGGDLQNIVGGFWEGVMRRAVVPFFGIDEDGLGGEQAKKDMVVVKQVDLGRG